MFRRLYQPFREETVTLDASEGILHGVLYRSERPSKLGVVIAPPDGEEGMYAYRPLVTSARALVARGVTVLRFDYRGQGQSDGEYESMTFDTRVSDLSCAARALRAYIGAAPTLLGALLGGTVVIGAAASVPDVERVILWEPVLDSAAYVQQLL